MNQTLSFIYIHSDGKTYSYANRLDNSFPLKEWAWSNFYKQLQPCYCYAILNESYLLPSAPTGHSYKPVCILSSFDSIEECRAVNQEYYTQYMKISQENYEHITYKNEYLQEFVDEFCEKLLSWDDFRKDQKVENENLIKENFGNINIDDFFGDDDEDPLKIFFNM